MHHIESILQFPNPSTPDLGCFIRQKHGFETDPDVDFLNVHVEFNQRIERESIPRLRALLEKRQK